MKIEWLAGAKQIPTIGRVTKGQIFPCDKDMANSYINQGLAKKYNKADKIEKVKIIDDYTRDELIHACVEKGIDPPDDANKKKLKELLQEDK